MAYIIRSFGVALGPQEEHDLGPTYDAGTFAADCRVLARYRASLDAEKREREQHGLMRRLSQELERRGVDPYMDGEE